ncbi:MAG TPA: PilZ domain-containing protein [Pyrinomonadaceae bacterium]|jgi:hypothetical protein|nr:PilZ domain-containing protein [Pyrinomonadaceae bacterium]
MSSHPDLLPPVGGERRNSLRYLVPLGSPLIVGGVALGGRGKPRTFTARARDVSRAGMAIVLPPDAVGGELVGSRRSLAVVVSLPLGVIRFSASPVYRRPPDEGQTERGYVVGLRVTEISEHDQNLLDEYLSGLGGGGVR